VPLSASFPPQRGREQCLDEVGESGSFSILRPHRGFLSRVGYQKVIVFPQEKGRDSWDMVMGVGHQFVDEVVVAGDRFRGGLLTVLQVEIVEPRRHKLEAQRTGERQQRGEQKWDINHVGHDFRGTVYTCFGRCVHEHCFQCSNCGTDLGGVVRAGQKTLEQPLLINEKLYCQLHGQQRKQLLISGDSNKVGRGEVVVDPDTAVRLPPTGYQPTRPVEPPRAAYQPSTALTESCKMDSNNNPWVGKRIVKSSDRPQTAVQHKTNTVPATVGNKNLSSELNKILQRKIDKEKETEKHEPLKKSISHTPPVPPPMMMKKEQRSVQKLPPPPSTNRPNEVGRTVCEFCKDEISGPYVLANGRCWCPEHFICSNSACARRLLGSGFIQEEDGAMYCDKCYEHLIAPSCAKCGLPITSDCLSAIQKQWHTQCFTCTHCRRSFGNMSFYLEDGKPYCETDWNQLFTTKCGSCKGPIKAGQRWVEALGSSYHTHCFNCSACQSNLEGQNFYAKEGRPYCRLHI